MCGISGFIEQGRNLDYLNATAQAMAAAMEHRGPDGWGVWADESAGIALSHRRLSIQDLSEAGKQPIDLDELLRLQRLPYQPIGRLHLIPPPP